MPEARDEALLERASELLRERVVLAPDFEARVMARVRAGRRPRRGAIAWWLEHRTVTIRLRPVWTLAAAAVVAGVFLMPWERVRAPAPGEVVVTFVAPFPEATTVSVAGSFSAWQPVPLEREPSGVFRGRIAIAVGVHEYMFVVDGDRWVTDPLADSYADDGFGRLNAVLVARRGAT